MRHVKPGKSAKGDSPIGRKKSSAKVRRSLSIKQEERIAHKGGGRRVPGSGAFGGNLNGDVSLDDWLIEAKRTENKSFSINGAVIHKAYAEAVMANKKFAMSIEIAGMDSSLFPSRFMLVLEDDFFAVMNGGSDDDDGD